MILKYTYNNYVTFSLWVRNVNRRQLTHEHCKNVAEGAEAGFSPSAAPVHQCPALTSEASSKDSPGAVHQVLEAVGQN